MLITQNHQNIICMYFGVWYLKQLPLWKYLVNYNITMILGPIQCNLFNTTCDNTLTESLVVWMINNCLISTVWIYILIVGHCQKNGHTLIARFMGPTWGPDVADRTQVGPTLAPWTLLFGYTSPIWVLICSGLVVPKWWHRTGSTLAQVIICCLMAPSHYMN